MRLYTTFLLICLFAFGNAAAIEPSQHLRQANISFVVADAETGETVAAYTPERVATPASITKLLTTATALELLGSDFRFTTTVAYDGTFANGTIDGNVYIVGGGDPSLGSKQVNDSYFLNRWCQQMKALGVRRITGNIVADASAYEVEAVPPKWVWEDMGNYYGAGVFGLSVYDNTLNILMRSGADGTQPTILNVTPQIEGLQLYNYAKSNHTEMDSAYVYGMPYDNRRWIVGAVPANRGQFLLKGDIPNPPLCVAEHFAARLRDFGITIDGAPTDRSSGTRPRTTLFTHHSEPLAELCKITNFMSNNNYAEHIFRQLAAQPNATATNNSAIAIEKHFWQARGVDFQGISINDGSGLSPMDGFSADFLNKILLLMFRSPNYQTFLHSIPIAGQEGSVKPFLRSNKTAEVHAKSGSMSGVQSYAGYIMKGTKTYTFCVIVNHFDTRRQVRREIESWLLSIIENM